MPQILVYLILALPFVGAYALYATGIVVIYQASRVLNLAHGAMATVPAYIVYTMVVKWHVPTVLAVIVGIASGAVLGLVIERLFVRRLRSISATAQTVGTVAAYGMLISVTAKVWGTEGLTAPQIFPTGHVNVGESTLRYGQMGLFVIAGVATLMLAAFFAKTWFGLAMKSAADNRQGAALMGVDPDRTAAAAWALGGALAGLAGILLASVTILLPYSLSLSVLPAFVAALIGGLQSLPAALIGSLIVGGVIGLVPVVSDLPGLRLVFGQVGSAQLALAITAMVVMAFRGKRLVASDVRGEVSNRARVLRKTTTRRMPVILLFVLVGWVFLPRVPFSLLGDANQALLYLIVALSLVMLTGWVGQISLAQGAFVGVGAFGSIIISNRLHIPFPFNVPIAGLLAAGVAASLGMVALRVRGLFLAVATLIFGWMADEYLFSSPWFVGSGGSATVQVKPIGIRGGYPFFDFADRRTFYLVALAGAGLALMLLINLRSSKTGRAFFAVRGSEVAAASLGIDVTRYKLLAFGLSGFIAGIAGSLVATGQQTIVPLQFGLTFSLLYLSIAVVGGLESIGGAVAASLVFAGMNELFFRVEALHGYLEVVSASLLALVLLFYPGGFSALPETMARFRQRREERRSDQEDAFTASRRWSGRLHRGGNIIVDATRWTWGQLTSFTGEISDAWADVRRSTTRRVGGLLRLAPFSERSAVPGHTNGITSEHVLQEEFVLPANRGDRTEVLGVEGVTVRFGGLLATADVSLSVRRGEIVGLIGPNGAGKTTLFNAIAGFVTPTEGRVRFRDEDVTELAVHERAARGLGRTFQVIQLFPQLSVIDNLLVATHSHNPTGFVSHVTVSPASARAEEDAMRRVREVLPLVGLEDVVDEPVASLPFGTLRLVEIARVLVAGGPVVMLDEPASGLDNAETERLTDLLRDLRRRLTISLLLIEHDVAMVMGVCDYVYVLDRGVIIAHGTPAEVKANPVVTAAYLGGADETAEGSAAAV